MIASRLSAALVAGPIVAGLAVAAWAWHAAPATSATGVEVAPRAPLSEALDSDACASCHPRQSAEWHRSVMAHSVKSPLFQALEILIQEQAGRDFACPGGAGVLREADPVGACRAPGSGLPITGSGGPLWCVNCHAPGENLRASLPPWDGRSPRSASRLPLRDLLPETTMDGISCVFCHQVAGPVQPGLARVGRYEGNPSWTSAATGRVFPSRPEDALGQFGVANSGYLLAPTVFLADQPSEVLVPGGAHARPPAATKQYLRSSAFCGACHDVRLFGTDVIGVVARGEHFKRLRNAYSEWQAWGAGERAQGRPVAECQDCHMSLYPGVCVPDADRSSESDPDRRDLAQRACPPGTAMSPRPPGVYPSARPAAGTPAATVTTHYFSGVDHSLDPTLDPAFLDDPTLDVAGIPMGARSRRDLLLARAIEFELGRVEARGDRLEIPIDIENVGAGHRIPAGFSQEREIWVHLRVVDAQGRTVYEVGRVDRPDQDLGDKVFLRVGTRDDLVDGAGRPQGLFGADVADGPDVPDWAPELGGGTQRFRGQGLVNFQNGFLRCVRCIGEIAADGSCQPGPGQRAHRAARYADGDYDIDTGVCRSNLRGRQALFEVYFPVGALDASRGVLKGPDAIIDTRSLAPRTPVRYTYDLPVRGADGPFTIEARLLFRAFPPFLVRAFADYEARADALGLRPSGPLVTRAMLGRLDIVELAFRRVRVPRVRGP
ncbi:hypothetical protein [Haliangium sp.]|uniref:hypothetical protein n=1 Tax=Haliangium sp. TaxID=2663208 RepID=UPI003D0DB309